MFAPSLKKLDPFRALMVFVMVKLGLVRAIISHICLLFARGYVTHVHVCLSSLRRRCPANAIALLTFIVDMPFAPTIVCSLSVGTNSKNMCGTLPGDARPARALCFSMQPGPA